MKKILLVLAAILMLVGCYGRGVKLTAPLNQNLDEMVVLAKQAEDSEHTIYLDPFLKSKQVKMGASGGICKVAEIDVQIGPGLSRRLQEGFKSIFPKSQFAASDIRSADSSIMNIEIKSVDIGFEFSAVSQGHGCNPTSKMDKGWFTLVTDVQTLDRENKEVFRKTFTLNERQESIAAQLAYRDEILEISLNKIVIKLLRNIRKDVKGDFPKYIVVKMDEKALEKVEAEARAKTAASATK